MSFNLSAVMDGIAEALKDVNPRVYAWPTDAPSPPCFVVGYPEEIMFDQTFARGLDSAIIPVYFIAGQVNDRTTREMLSNIIDGTEGVKDALDGSLDGVDSSFVDSANITTVEFGGITYAAVKFNVQIDT